MSRSRTPERPRPARRWARNALLVAVAAGGGIAAGSSNPAEAFPFPDPTYDIIAVSNGHEASLLDLHLGQPGAPQAPVPVDVDGDLLPDVTVAVNLLDPAGVVGNPPPLQNLPVPNIEINRILTGSLLGQPLPPLRIEIQLTLVDMFGDGPDTTLRFGYDTGPGGSIPPTFKARLGGIEDFFNPLVATVDTGPSALRPQTYDGPLRLVGGLDSGDTHVDLGLGFSPFPRQLRVSYATDEVGQHITYRHDATGLNGREVDARAEIDLETATGETHVDARIDRLPNAIEVDIASPPDSEDDDAVDAGAISWRSSSDGRRPDLEANVTSTSTDPDRDPLHAEIDLDSLPPEVNAAWSLVEDGPIDVQFDTGDPDAGTPGAEQGIGGIDVDIRNHAADAPGALARFLPEQRQFLSVHQAEGPGGDVLRRITGRVERVRSASFSDADGVLAAEVSMGDGESPFQVDYDCEAACSTDGATRLVDVDATVSPLPADFGVSITDAGEDPRDEPMLIDYSASTPVDVEASIGLAQAGSTGDAITCGAARTVCADLSVRDLPSELHASLGQYTSEHDEDEVPEEADLRLAVDLGPQGTGDDASAPIPPDLTASVVLGPEQAGDDPLVADAEIIDLSRHLRVYLHQHREETDEGDALALDRAAFHACDRAVDREVCAEGTEGEIGAITLSLRSFLDRPPGFPVPLHDRPQYATVTGRPGSGGADDRDLEVGARIEHVRDLEYLNTGALQGVFAAAGDGETPFTANIDLTDVPADDVDLGDDDEGNERILTGVTRDLAAEAVVTDLPPSFGVCFRTPHEDLVEADRAFTEACETTTLEGDPLAFAYQLDVDEDDDVEVAGTFATTVAGQLGGAPYSETLEGEATVPDVPTSVVVQASLPEEDTVGPIDAVYDASDTLDIDFAARMLVNDASCLDPRATAEAMCVEAYLDDIPSDATVFYDPTSTVDNLRVHTEYPPDQSAASRMDLRQVRLSAVSPRQEPIDEPVPTPSVLIVEGDVIDLPTDVHGTIVTPDDDGDGDDATTPAQTLVVCASDQGCAEQAITGEIGRITLHARNVVVADPTPLGGTGSLTPQRTGLPAPTDQVVAYARGRAFHAFVDLGNIANVGYRQVADSDGRRLETDELQLGFGPNATPEQVIRAFVDLDAGTDRTIADVTLQDVPLQTTFCFRGADLSAGIDPAADVATFCDTAPEDHEGAVQVVTEPRDGSDGLDLDAFVRQTTGGDANGIAARIRAGNVPALLEGTVPAEGRGSLDIGGFDAGGAPDGFDQLRFEIASFDITDTGYTDPPWDRTIGKPSNDFPAPDFGGQHLSVVATDSGFHARGQVDGLQRIALRDGLCTAMAGPGGGDDVRDDYPYYPAAVPGTQPYTCIRTEFDAAGAGQDLDLHAFVRGEDGDLLSLTDAGIDRLPAVMQMTLADVAPTNDDAEETLKAPCPVAEAGTAADDGCLPPMVRVDVEAADPGNPPQVFGLLQIGSEGHLVELGEAEARGNPIENAVFDSTIDSMPALGANVKIGTWSDIEGYAEEVEEGTAVIARLRLPLPYSLSVDTPQTWSDTIGDDAEEPDRRSTDLRMHYVARTGPTTVVDSLGDLRLLVHSEPDNTQTLLHGGGFDGLNIPGELAVAVYLRDDVLDKRLFAQIDGAVSSEVSLTASILGATPPTDPENLPEGYERPMDRMTFEVRHLPQGPFGGWDDPWFRIQAEVIDDSPPPEGCSATSCSISESRMREVRGLLDLHPDGSATPPARKVQAVVRTLEEGPLGIQVAGYQNITDQPNGSMDDGNAEITLAGELTIDPLYAYTFEGVPFLANYEVEVDTSLHVGMSVDRASDFQLFSNKLGVVTNYDGSGSAIVGPLDLRPNLLYVDVTFLGATVFGLDLSPFYDQGTPLDLDFFDCDAGSVVGMALLDGFAYGSTHLLTNLPWNDDEIAYEVGQGRDDTVIFPEIDLDTMIPSGPGGFLADAFPSLRAAIGCGMFDQEEVDLINAEHPGVPMPTPGHEVPGSSITVDTPPVVTQPTTADTTTVIGDAVMCGRNIYQGTVQITGTVSVTTDPGAITEGSCLPGFGGGLEIVADEILVDPGAVVDADALVDVTCSSPFVATSTYDFASNHEADPNAEWNTPFHPNHAGCTAYLDTANGRGAGHHAAGGTAGPFATPGGGHGAYDGASLTRNDPGIVTAGYQGGAGSGGPGGLGGGVIRLVADRVTVDGTLTAVGGPGSDAAFGPDDDPCATSTVGGGGGSGGGIAVAANRIDIGPGAQLLARGGDGGAAAFSSGGGSGGDIELLAGIIATAGAVDPTIDNAFIAGGAPGAACADSFLGSGGGDGSERAEERPQSSVLPLGNGPGGLWWTNDDVDGDGVGEVVDVPVVAAASDGSFSGANDTGVTIALCGVPITPETEDAEGGFRALTPNIPSSSTLCGLRSFGDFGGAFGFPTAQLLGHVYVEGDNDITPEDGVTIPLSGYDATAYVGLYTIAIRSDIPGNDCFDGDFFDLTCFGVTNVDTSDPQNDCDNPYDYVGLNQPWTFGSLYYDQFWGIFEQNPGRQYDADVCVYDNLESPPGELGPDLVIGIDNDAPDPADLSITFDPYDAAQFDADGNMWNNLEWIEGSVAGSDRVQGTNVMDLSGIDHFECFQLLDDGPRYFTCDAESGFETYTQGGEGRKTIGLVAVDRVGHRTTILDTSVVIDTTVPDSTMVALTPPNLENDWYSNSPLLQITGFPDPAPGTEAPPHPDHRYVYQIDDGPEIDCEPTGADGVCTITGEGFLRLPGQGRHTVWYTAVDRAGNRGERCDGCVLDLNPMDSIDLQVDAFAPIADTFAAPGLPDGANGWFRTRPWFGVGFADPPVGGSGIRFDRAPSSLEVAVIEQGSTLDDGDYVDYTQPRRLPAGVHEVTARARDDAGNPFPLETPPAPGPTRTYRVDPSAPIVTLDVTGPQAPGGTWFTDAATVTVEALDLPLGLGSGIDFLQPGSGLFVSVDDQPFTGIAAGGSLVVGEGEHVVRAYAVDVAGNASAVAERVVDVDRSHPVSELRTLPADPARAPWFRTRPVVVLRATDGDANAGVSSIRYCLGTGCNPDGGTTYVTPFTAPEGTTVVRWRAYDASGAANHEGVREQVVRADTAPPTPVATSASKLLWLRLDILGIQIGQPATIQLRFTVRDALPGPLRAQVVIYDALGNPVRRIDAAPINVVANTTTNGSVDWDGRVNPLGNLVPLGVYHYRVVLVDQAGNIAESGESRPITIKLG